MISDKSERFIEFLSTWVDGRGARWYSVTAVICRRVPADCPRDDAPPTRPRLPQCLSTQAHDCCRQNRAERERGSL